MREGVRQQGREFGDYEVFEELGQGGVGEAYVARPKRGDHAGTYVCLKIMGREFQAAKANRRREAIESLRHEARVVSQLQHPNIARLLDSGAYNDVWFLAFELVEGANLRELIALQPIGVGLLPEYVRRIGIEVAGALQCAHEHDVLHRDIKPSNIMVGTDGRVKLVDFGLAKANARNAADFTVGVGTPRYWVPEQIREEPLTPQTDIYALGVVLHELLTTLHPFHHEEPVEFRKNVLRGAVQNSLGDFGVPDEFAAIVERCLQGDPAKRFQSAESLQAALRSGAKPSGFEYDMGEIASAAREAAAETRAFGPESEMGAGCDEAKTVVADLHCRDTRHEIPRVLAETVRDGIPGAMSRHERDAVMNDLSVLAREAYLQRQSETAKRRLEQAVTEGGGADTSGVRRSELRRSVEARPRAERARSMFDTVPRGPRKTPRGSAQTRPSSEPETTPEFGALSAAPLPATTPRVKPKRPAAWWGIAIVAAIAAAVVAALAVRSDRSPSESSTRKSDVEAGAAPRDQNVLQSQEGNNVEGKVEPVGLAAPQQPSAAVVTPGSASDPSQPPSAEGASRKTKGQKANSRELVNVTIGIIPYGEVIIDGRSVGQAPVVVKLAPGTHRIVGRYLKLRQAKTVVVTPEVRRVVLDLRNVESPK